MDLCGSLRIISQEERYDPAVVSDGQELWDALGGLNANTGRIGVGNKEKAFMLIPRLKVVYNANFEHKQLFNAAIDATGECHAFVGISSEDGSIID